MKLYFAIILLVIFVGGIIGSSFMLKKNRLWLVVLSACSVMTVMTLIYWFLTVVLVLGK